VKQPLKLLCIFLIQTLHFHAADMKTKDSELNIYAVIDFNLLLILFLNVLWFVIFVSVCLNFASFLKVLLFVWFQLCLLLHQALIQPILEGWSSWNVASVYEQ
jgi:hypothetical protein